MLTRASVFVFLNYDDQGDEFEVKLKKISSKFHVFFYFRTFSLKKSRMYTRIYLTPMNQ